VRPADLSIRIAPGLNFNALDRVHYLDEELSGPVVVWKRAISRSSLQAALIAAVVFEPQGCVQPERASRLHSGEPQSTGHESVGRNTSPTAIEAGRNGVANV
jgi:hypothetical protein